MHLTPDRVRALAALTSLSLTDAEQADLSHHLTRALDYMRLLDGLDLSDAASHAQAPSHPLPLPTPWREDTPAAPLPQADALANAPHTRDGLFVAAPLASLAPRLTPPPTPAAATPPHQGAASLRAPQPSLTALTRALAAGEARALHVTERALAAVRALNPSLRALLWIDEAAALRAAEASDARRARGEPLGPLHGVPLAIKDNLCTRAAPTTCASRALAGFMSPYESEATARLWAAGALLLGKANMDEFAMGSANTYSASGPALNPWDLRASPGGSSGGAAAAVASGMAPAALGSDTGGSVRQPAAMCGLVGLKPTYGRVSRHGLIALAPSLDHVGILAQSVDDAALLLRVLSGHDPKDPTSSAEVTCDARVSAAHPWTVGIPQDLLSDGVQPDILAALSAAADALRAAGCRVLNVSLPHTPYAVAAYHLLCAAEASSSLARFDGVRFGHGPDAFGPEVKRRVLLGAFVLSDGYHDAYYVRAQRVRARILQDFTAAFTACDLLLTPTAPTTAAGLTAQDPLSLYLADAFTAAPSLAGLPALSLPWGLDRHGLPIGLQLIAPPWAEPRLLDAARAVEAASPPLPRPSTRSI